MATTTSPLEIDGQDASSIHSTSSVEENSEEKESMLPKKKQSFVGGGRDTIKHEEFERLEISKACFVQRCFVKCFTHPNLRALTVILLFTTGFTVAQGIGSVYANSVSMAADSGTMVVDSVTYVVSLATEYRKLSGKHSKTLELYASLMSVLGLFAVTVAVMIDANFRLCCDPGEEPVNPQIMFGFTMVNLIIDVVECYLYSKTSTEVESEGQEVVTQGVNLNMTSAFMHLLADTLRTITVLASSIMVWGMGFDSVQTDAIGSLVVSFFILIGGTYVCYELYATWCGRTNDLEHKYSRTLGVEEDVLSMTDIYRTRN